MRSKIIIILAILVVILGAAFLWQTVSLVQVKRNYSNLLSATDDHQIENKQYLKNLERIKSIIAKKAASPTQIIEQSMDFVHDNSLHVIDKERNKYLYETSLDKFLQEGIQALLTAAQGGSSVKKIHLSCGLRAQLMKKILSQFGIYSRIIQIFSDKYKVIKGHRLLEVFNPETKAWEVWDPDYRVTYINRNNGRPVDSIFFIFGDKKEIIPKNGEIMGWEETKTTHLRDDFAGAIMFEKKRATSPGNLLLVNRNQFDIRKVFSGGLTFKKFAATYLNIPRIILVQ